MSRTLSVNKLDKVIMVVDDDPHVTAIVEVYLGRLGYKSCTYHSGMVAMAKACKIRPACILLDLTMPEFDGFTFLRLRPKMQAISDIPVVVLSASQDRDDVKRAIDLGAAGYVTKPVEYDKLAGRLERIVPSPYFQKADTSEVSWRG